MKKTEYDGPYIQHGPHEEKDDVFKAQEGLGDVPSLKRVQEFKSNMLKDLSQSIGGQLEPGPKL